MLHLEGGTEPTASPTTIAANSNQHTKLELSRSARKSKTKRRESGKAHLSSGSIGGGAATFASPNDHQQHHSNPNHAKQHATPATTRRVVSDSMLSSSLLCLNVC